MFNPPPNNIHSISFYVYPPPPQYTFNLILCLPPPKQYTFNLILCLTHSLHSMSEGEGESLSFCTITSFTTFGKTSPSSSSSLLLWFSSLWHVFTASLHPHFLLVISLHSSLIYFIFAAVQLHTKLYVSREEVEKTATFHLADWTLSVAVTEKKKKKLCGTDRS